MDKQKLDKFVTLTNELYAFNKEGNKYGDVISVSLYASGLSILLANNGKADFLLDEMAPIFPQNTSLEHGVICSTKVGGCEIKRIYYKEDEGYDQMVAKYRQLEQQAAKKEEVYA